MQERDRFTETLLRYDLQKLNSHLPKIRRTLKELLDDPAPSVLSVSGETIKMKRTELQEMSSSLKERASERIRLPLVLLRRTDFGPGAFVILGDAYEEYEVLSLIGTFDGTFEEFKRHGRSPAVLYKSQVSLLLRRFHSLVAIGFGTNTDRP